MRFRLQTCGRESVANQMELKYHPAASDEVARAVKWYEEIDSRLADKFKLELARAERLVLRSPATWGPYLHGSNGFRFRGFPFVMAFIEHDEHIYVVALAHTRRRPGYWEARL